MMIREPLLNKSKKQNTPSYQYYTENLGEAEKGFSESDNNKKSSLTAAEACNEVINSAQQKTLAASSASLKTFEIACIPFLAIAAGVSGYLFWNDSKPAANRHFGHIESHVESVILMIAACLGGAAANALFNFESYLTLVAAIIRKCSQGERQLTGSAGEILIWAVSFFIGIFAVLPFWLMGSITNGWNIASAILNIGPNMDGAKNLVDSVRRLFFQKVQGVQWENPVHAYFSRYNNDPDDDPYRKKLLKQRTLRKLKGSIVDRVTEIANEASGIYQYKKNSNAKAAKTSHATSTGSVARVVNVNAKAAKTSHATSTGSIARVANVDADAEIKHLLEEFFEEGYKKEKDSIHFLDTLLISYRTQNEPVYRSSCGNSIGKYLFRFCFLFLMISGVSANVGFAGVTYLGLKDFVSSWGASESLSKIVGVAGAFFHTVPGIGFTIKGLSGLWDFGNKVVNGEETISKAEARTAYKILAATFVAAALFSGFSADEANHKTFLRLFPSAKAMAALIFGIIGNIGTAIPFNLPQILELLERMILFFLMKRKAPENDLLKKEQQERVKMLIELIEQLNHLAEVFKKIPEETLDVLLHGGKSDSAKESTSGLSSNLGAVFSKFVKIAQERGELTEEELHSLGGDYPRYLPNKKSKDGEQTTSERSSQSMRI